MKNRNKKYARSLFLYLLLLPLVLLFLNLVHNTNFLSCVV